MPVYLSSRTLSFEFSFKDQETLRLSRNDLSEGVLVSGLGFVHFLGCAHLTFCAGRDFCTHQISLFFPVAASIVTQV